MLNQSGKDNAVNYSMKKIFSLLPALLFLNVSFGQKQCTVTKAIAFYTISQPGIMPRDENGMPMKGKRNKQRFIYLLTSCKIKPVITSVTYGGVKVLASVNDDGPAKKAEVGSDNSGRPIILHAPAGYYYWKTDVVEINNSPVPDSGKYLLKGSVGKKSFTCIVYSEKEVEGLPVY